MSEIIDDTTRDEATQMNQDVDLIDKMIVLPKKGETEAVKAFEDLKRDFIEGRRLVNDKMRILIQITILTVEAEKLGVKVIVKI